MSQSVSPRRTVWASGTNCPSTTYELLDPPRAVAAPAPGRARSNPSPRPLMSFTARELWGRWPFGSHPAGGRRPVRPPPGGGGAPGRGRRRRGGGRRPGHAAPFGAAALTAARVVSVAPFVVPARLRRRVLRGCVRGEQRRCDGRDDPHEG